MAPPDAVALCDLSRPAACVCPSWVVPWLHDSVSLPRFAAVVEFPPVVADLVAGSVAVAGAPAAGELLVAPGVQDGRGPLLPAVARPIGGRVDVMRAGGHTCQPGCLVKLCWSRASFAPHSGHSRSVHTVSGLTGSAYTGIGRNTTPYAATWAIMDASSPILPPPRAPRLVGGLGATVFTTGGFHEECIAVTPCARRLWWFGCRRDGIPDPFALQGLDPILEVLDGPEDAFEGPDHGVIHVCWSLLHGSYFTTP